MPVNIVTINFQAIRTKNRVIRKPRLKSRKSNLKSGKDEGSGSHIGVGIQLSTLNKMIPLDNHCGNLIVPQPLDLFVQNLNRYILIGKVFIDPPTFNM